MVFEITFVYHSSFKINQIPFVAQSNRRNRSEGLFAIIFQMYCSAHCAKFRNLIHSNGW